MSTASSVGGAPSPTAPFGAWPSPITPESLAAGSVRITTLVAGGTDLWWSETRPGAKGRTIRMRRSADGSLREMTPPEANVRSRVHSYGGAAWWAQDGVCVYSDDADFRLRRLGPGDSEPEVLTPAGPDREYLYADGRLSADGEWFVCVRERPVEPEHVNEIVCEALDGSGRVEVAVSGADFYSDPRPSPCGRWLAVAAVEPSQHALGRVRVARREPRWPDGCRIPLHRRRGRRVDLRSCVARRERELGERRRRLVHAVGVGGRSARGGGVAAHLGGSARRRGPDRSMGIRDEPPRCLVGSLRRWRHSCLRSHPPWRS